MVRPRGHRPDLAPGVGVRFEQKVSAYLRAMADYNDTDYSEMVRTLVDEALYARLSAPHELDRGTLREAVLHAIEYGEG